MQTIVVGAGFWGRNFVKELGHNCVAVVDPDPKQRILVSNSFNIKSYPSIENVDEKYDAAVIATPPNCHVETSLKILEQGKYCLIEKPMSDSIENALKLAPYRGQIMVGHIYTYHEGITGLKIDSRRFRINHIFTRRTNAGPVRTWQDAMWDLAPHDISICNYILDDKPISSSVFRNKDFAVVELDYLGETKAVIYVSWLGSPKTRTIEVVTEQERLIFDDMRYTSETSPMRLMLDDFLKGTWKKECSYDAGLEVVQLLESLS